MNIGVINASSLRDKNAFVYESVIEHAAGHKVINFGCGIGDEDSYSYIEISVLVGLLLGSGAIDFIVTGCSSGQGMMLACNSMPGVLCGYVPAPRDAYLFAQINNGNAVSLPLGEEYTFSGYGNLDSTLRQLFIEPFGQGWPKEEAGRKLRDTVLLKEIRRSSQIGLIPLLEKLDEGLVRKALSKKDAVGFIMENGTDTDVMEWVSSKRL